MYRITYVYRGLRGLLRIGGLKTSPSTGGEIYHLRGKQEALKGLQLKAMGRVEEDQRFSMER